MKTKCSILLLSVLGCLLLAPSCSSSADAGVPEGFRKAIVNGEVYYRSGDRWYTRSGNRYTSCPKPY